MDHDAVATIACRALHSKSLSPERHCVAPACSALPLSRNFGALSFRSGRRIGVLLTALCFCSGVANAESNGKADPQGVVAPRKFNSAESRIVVDHFSGTRGELARAGVISALEAEDTLDLLSVRVLDAERGALDGSPAGYANVARRFDLGAILRGKVKSGDDGARITLTVVSGRDGKAIGKLSFEAASLPALRATLRNQLWSELQPLLAAATGREPNATDSDSEKDAPRAAERPIPDAVPTPEAPAVAPTAPASERKPDLEPKSEPDPDLKPELELRPSPGPSESTARCARLEFELGGGAQGRLFNYVHEQRGALRAYRGNPGPMARADAVGYPLASASCRVRAGLAVGYERLLKVESELASAQLASNGFGAHAELVLRLALGPLSVEPGLGYAGRHFEIKGGFIPKADYQAFTSRLRLDLEVGRFLLEGSVGGHFLLGTGQLRSASWFPGAAGRGYDADARVGVRFAGPLYLLVGAHYELYSFDLNPQVDGDYPNGVALGARDQYFDGTLSLRLRL